MRLTRFAIEKRRVTAVAVVAVLVAGSQTYLNMPRSEDPGFLIRVAVVTTLFPGAGPTRVEQLVTDRIETVVRQLPELDIVTSQSRSGVSIVFVEIRDEYFDLQPIWDELRRKVDAVEPELPAGVVGPFVNDDYGDVFGILVSITGPGFSYRQLHEVAKQVRDELLFLPDAAKVQIYGRQEERLFLDFSNARLAEYRLSPSALREVLAAQNIVSAGGSVATGTERIALEPSGNFEAVEELAETTISLPGGELVALRDLVSIRRDYADPPRTIRRSNGLPAVGLALSMREGGNLIELGDEVRALLDQLEMQYPHGIALEISQFQPEIVQQKIDDFESNVLQAVLIVSLVMLAFLGIRTGLIVATLVPLAMVSAIVVMGVLDVGLNQMSLAALIIALGMLVDNAIVMSESIMVMMRSGETAVDAATKSSRELSLSLLTSSLTTAAAFLPIYLAENEAGEYTAPLFTVVTITLLCSWVVSLTVIPLLCVLFLRVQPEPDGDPYSHWFYSTYRGMLSTCLRRPVVTVAAALAMLLLAGLAFRFVPKVFFPDNDRPLLIVELEFPFGTAIEHNDEVVREIEAHISGELMATRRRPEGITSWISYVGEGGPRFALNYQAEQPASHVSTLLVNATSREFLQRVAPALERWCVERFPGLVATARPLQTGSASWPPVQIQIMGRDLDTLFSITDEVKEQLASIEGTRLINDDWGAQARKLLVNVDQAKARRAGVTSRDIAISMDTYLSGLETTEFRERDELIPVTLRANTRGRQDLADLETVNIFPGSGGPAVPLKQIASIELDWEPGVIRRRDRLRTVTVEAATIQGVTPSEVVEQLTPWLEKSESTWPFGYRWRFSGEYDDSAKSSAAINAKLSIAAIAAALLLVLQFDSIRKPSIILLTIPFGFIGVVFGLLVADSYFGFMTLLGIISLSGIVINNAIVLIDRIQIELDEFGREPRDAVIQAAQRRLRPILLTTATTAGGLIPLWLGGGPIFEPLAIAVLFGLLFATLLTLVLVPVLYTLFFGVDYSRGS